MSTNAEFNKAKKEKNDEFYTYLMDIEKEMVHYRDKFFNKIVLCNCDDPEKSNFWKYFHLNFERLGLKKLISTHYDATKPTYVMEYMGGADNDISRGLKRGLNGNGDFRNQECLYILQESDIVVTNPPFSLFREFVATLIKYDKQFLIIGNMNAITCKEIFPLFRENRLWYGASIHSGDRMFGVPDDYPLEASGCGIDEQGQRYIKVKGVRWFTNIDYSARHEKLILWKKYNMVDFPMYENYNAINVNKYSEIPIDYVGIMGVPITFMDFYCPEQFEILGMDKEFTTDRNRGLINGQRLYARLFIKRKSVGIDTL